MKRTTKITAVLLCICATSAHANFALGNRLYGWLNNGDTTERGIATGYVLGVHDSGLGIFHCSPDSVTSGQIRDVVQQFLAANPVERNKPADLLIHIALGRAWPCQKQQKKGGADL